MSMCPVTKIKYLLNSWQPPIGYVDLGMLPFVIQPSMIFELNERIE
jgi:hypothetical protein